MSNLATKALRTATVTAALVVTATGMTFEIRGAAALRVVDDRIARQADQNGALG